MKRIWKIGLALALVTTALALGARAFAHGTCSGGRHLEQRLESALQAAKATPAQRAAVHAAADQVVATVSEEHRGQGNPFEEALTLFEADRLDQAAIARHRALKETSLRKISDSVVQALHDTHDAFTSEQRRLLADWARAENREHATRFGGEFMLRRVSSRIDDALDAARATAAQKEKAHAARDRVFALLDEMRQARSQQLEQALAVFTADSIDAAKVEALRAGHAAEAKRVGDAVVQSLVELHDTLDAGQRKTLVDWVKSHRPRWEAHHG